MRLTRENDCLFLRMSLSIMYNVLVEPTLYNQGQTVYNVQPGSC